MSEEEKKAIDILKDFTENEDTAYCYDWDGFDYKTILSAIECLLNLIEKQKNQIASQGKQIKLMQSCDLAKVIKEQQNEIGKQQEEIEQLANGIRVLGTNPDITTEEIIKEFTEKPITEEYIEEFESRYISKDEVLKAIGYEENDEEYDRLKQDDEKLLAILDTMYSEFCRLEDIEDKKVEVAITFIEEKRDKYWQNKIKEKMSEIMGYTYTTSEERHCQNYAYDRLKELSEE